MTKPERAKPQPSKKCPICDKPRDQKFDPFCSRRCSDVDLYRWLKGGYVIPGAEPAGEDRSEKDDD